MVSSFYVQVGILSHNFPVVSFQESQSPAAYDRLVQLVQPYITSPDAGVKAAAKAKAASKDQQSHSFQVSSQTCAGRCWCVLFVL